MLLNIISQQGNANYDHMTVNGYKTTIQQISTLINDKSSQQPRVEENLLSSKGNLLMSTASILLNSKIMKALFMRLRKRQRRLLVSL